MGFSPFKLYWMDGLTHRVNIYIEDKATQIVLQLENFMSFDRNFRLLNCTQCEQCTLRYSNPPPPPTSPEEDRAHILSKNMDVCDKDKTPYLFWFLLELSILELPS